MAGSGTTRRRTCSKGVLHLINTSDARPAGPKQALPGRSRPPSASVQRRKLFPAPTAKNKLNWFNSIKYLPALASGARRTARGAGLFFVIYLRLTGGSRIYKTPARRPLLRPPRWSFLLMFCRHRAEAAGK
jgi:hypothetical protein